MVTKIVGGILFSGLTVSLLFNIKQQRENAKLTQDLIISKTNEANKQVQLDNYKALTTNLQNKLKKQEKIREQEKKRIQESQEKIKQLSTPEQGQLINSIFQTLVENR